MEGNRSPAALRDKLLRTLRIFDGVPDDTQVIAPLASVTFATPGVEAPRSELLHRLDASGGWAEGYER